MKHKEKKSVQTAPAENPISFSEDKDFQFVQLSSDIHDRKFQTKATTFFSDALHRFAKSKSSMVAAVFLGIIIAMAILVPQIDTSNVSNDYILSAAAFLPPKWYGFDGTGFMDGTEIKSNVLLDQTTKLPVNQDTDKSGYDPTYIRGSITTSEVSTTQADVNAYGGDVQIQPSGSTDADVYGGVYSSSFRFYMNQNYSITIDLDTAACEADPGKPSYAVYLLADFDSSVDGYETEFCLQDYGTDYADVTLADLASTIKTSAAYLANPKASFSAEFNIRVTNPRTNPYPNLYIAAFTATSATYPETFKNINFASGNELLLRDASASSAYAYRWKINGNAYKFLAKAKELVGSFRYDRYASAFGNVSRDFSKTDLQTYIDKGWCSYDWSLADDAAPASFKILNDSCPIISVESQTTSTFTSSDGSKIITVSLHGVYSKLRYYGFSSMPYYLFGTDAHGRDYFKYLFEGLRTSLILGVLTAVVNIAFGLIWGAVSGYFGGWTDILMERFTEILGGVPWIIVMTLVILHLGSNFWTFALALCLTGWMGVAGETRSQFYRYKGREYVLASRTLGAKDWRLIFKHILPNGIGPIITGAVLMVPSVIFDEATISYLGLGLQGLASFGVALSDAQSNLANYPYLIISGSIIMSIMMISFNLFGNGLRDAFNPSLKGVDA
jgi:oligopeptide transport system permease protein